MKEDRIRGGGKEREIELKESGFERSTGKNDEHRDKNVTKVTNFSSIKQLLFSIYNRPFKEEEEGVETKGHFVAIIRV